jgi:hypothetical protein
MCINWPMIAGIMISALVWWSIIRLAAYEVGELFIRQYAAQ